MFDLIERRCLDGDSLLDQPVKQLPPVFGTATIEPEGKFVQVGTQLEFGKTAVMDSQKPTLEQGRRMMDSWHKPGGFFPALFGNSCPMNISQLGHVHVDGQSVRDDHRAGSDGFLDERHQVFLGGVRDMLNPNSAGSMPTDFRGDYYQ